MPQATGPFPDDVITDRPFISPEGGRDGLRKTVGALEHALVGLKQLGLEVKEAHWNVSGTLFSPLHIQLQEQDEGVEKLTDQVAERLLAIGSSADAHATTVARTAPLPEIPGGFLDDGQVISWFIGADKTVADETEAGVSDTDKVDPTSSNLLQEVEDKLAHTQWTMRASNSMTHSTRLLLTHGGHYGRLLRGSALISDLSAKGPHKTISLL